MYVPKNHTKANNWKKTYTNFNSYSVTPLNNKNLKILAQCAEVLFFPTNEFIEIRPPIPSVFPEIHSFEQKIR